ncbi:MAG: ATP-dependent DNA helicase RecG [Oscillospiraceae bacterium]|jgi:ATP-dependent DNA helicase RecG|nr:ATP-dependent DNA helicase RecG [Oscillospiraceae bacterium]
MNLGDNICFLKGVGDKRAKQLQRLEITTPLTLLQHYPRAYQDWQTHTTIAGAPIDTPCCVCATIDYAPVENCFRQGQSLFKTQATDSNGDKLGITIFNSAYAAKQLIEGQTYLFYGKISENFLMREMNSPQFLPPNEAKLHPVYPCTAGITSRQIETLVAAALPQVLGQITETLPEWVVKQYDLLTLQHAFVCIHQPKDQADINAARRRLAFDELFHLQLGLQKLRLGTQKQKAFAIQSEEINVFLRRLPFTPTNAQLRVTREAASDMQKQTPMHRLLQGDVGAGKTVVAAALLFATVQNGYQGAFLAPTEILARQHHHTLETLFGARIKPELLIGSTAAAEKKRIKSGLRTGSIPLVVGTHALLQDDVAFAKLALAVVDEQHRFGVRQRGNLERVNTQAASPHVLAMSATPIPRSLAMVIFGDLDISSLDELPPGRQPIETYVVQKSMRPRAYRYVAKHLDDGFQAYVVCPRVEDDTRSETASVKAFADELREHFLQGYSVGILHGKQSGKEKERVMRDFAAGTLQVLVATTVIEVGLDVPNAVIMVVENAEFFGLSQLHQLRGRVGRGAAKSTCILVSDSETQTSVDRLNLLRHNTDGFALAQADLETRGPGDFFGARQHGLPPFKMANLLTDTKLLEETKQAALLTLEARH